MRIYASDAIAEARTGFLANYRRQLEEMLASDKPAASKAGWRREIALIDAADGLAPDEVIAASGPRTLAGRPLEVAPGEPRRHRRRPLGPRPREPPVIAGGPGHPPAPFLDTACPAGWQTALAHLARPTGTSSSPATAAR